MRGNEGTTMRWVMTALSAATLAAWPLRRSSQW